MAEYASSYTGSQIDDLLSRAGYLSAEGKAPNAILADSATLASNYLPLSGGTLTGQINSNSIIKTTNLFFGYAYGGLGNNSPAFIFDKPGPYYSGIGANSITNRIYFGPVASDGTYTWIDNKTLQTWQFGGNLLIDNNLTISNSVTINGSNLIDYIIEQGTATGAVSGIGTDVTWYYRKYKSGIRECWGRATTTRSSATWGQIYYASGSDPCWAFPSGLFTEPPVLTFNCFGSSGVWSASGALYNVTATTTCRIMPISAAAYTDMPCVVTMHAIGR